MFRWHKKRHQPKRAINPAKHHRRVKWWSFVKGFASVLIVAGVFYSGYQVGNGSWSLHIGQQPIEQNQTLPDELDYSSVDEIYQALKQSYDGQLNVDDLITGLKKGLVAAAGDPYTVYMDKEEATAFEEQLNGSFSGIGAELGKRGVNVVIISPLSGFPAEAVGLRAGDVIIAIDDQDATNLSIDEAVARIRGEAGTTVKLTIFRNDNVLDFTITRAVITIPSVYNEILDGNIGYVQITRFAEDTMSTFSDIADNFKAAGVNGIVLDLRNNPGGYLDGSVNIAGYWLNKGQVILEEKRAGVTIQTYTASKNGLLVSVPTVVLINEGSASASEIVSGALKDNGAATILGVTSFGKGSVQEFTTFLAGDVLKVTVARWYTPSGQNIDQDGIVPDVTQELSDDDIANNVDSQLNAAINLLQP